MRVSLVLSDGHEAGVDPRWALERDRELVAAARGRLAGITLHDGWATAPRWNLQALTAGAFLAAGAEPLELTIRGLPLGVRNPVELAEQLAAVDHAWGGRFRAGLVVASAAQCSAFGVAPELAAPRFEEGLGLVRAMWRAEVLTGAGPQYPFGEIRPTMRPARPEGPPLSLAAATPAGAAEAARLGLGLYVPPDGAGALEELLNAYAGAGAVSTALSFAGATAPGALAGLAAAGVEQVDVRLREPGDAPAAVLARLDELVAAAAALVH